MKCSVEAAASLKKYSPITPTIAPVQIFVDKFKALKAGKGAVHVAVVVGDSAAGGWVIRRARPSPCQ